MNVIAAKRNQGTGGSGHQRTPGNGSDPARMAPSASNDPWRWLSEVEEMCRRAFVPDEMILDRSRAKVAVRNKTRLQVDVREPARRKGELNVMSAANAFGGSFNDLLVRDLPPDLEAIAQAKALTGRNNRDLLAHRVGRVATTRWQGDASDGYASPRAYRRRLGVIGNAMVVLGWMPEPVARPWAGKAPPPKPIEDPSREADAVENARQWIG